MNINTRLTVFSTIRFPTLVLSNPHRWLVQSPAFSVPSWFQSFFPPHLSHYNLYLVNIISEISISTNQILAFDFRGESPMGQNFSKGLSMESLNPLFLSSLPPSFCLHHSTDLSDSETHLCDPLSPWHFSKIPQGSLFPFGNISSPDLPPPALTFLILTSERWHVPGLQLWPSLI